MRRYVLVLIAPMYLSVMVLGELLLYGLSADWEYTRNVWAGVKAAW